METLVVGEGELTLHAVANEIEKSTSFAILQTRWREFAGHIGISDAELPGLDLAISSRAPQLKEVPRELLKIWKADNGTRATLEVLCKALDECHLSDITDALKRKFCPAQLDEEVRFILQDKVYTTKQLFENNIPAHITYEIRSYLQAHRTIEPIQIIRKEVCPLDLPPYYIRRTLSDRKELDKTILKADTAKEHIFLVKGAKKHELARASGFKPIESSGNQLDKATVQHIILEHDDDIFAICGTTSKPVHMVEFTANSFFHLKSRGGMEEIQAFIKETGVSFDEEEAVKRIEKLQSPFALSISDSPGMGKTFVLAKLSALIKANNPKAIILFVALQELARNLRRFKSSSAVFKAISSYATSNHLTNIIFQEILGRSTASITQQDDTSLSKADSKQSQHYQNISNFQFFLFLDGYDEVMLEKLDSVDLFIQNLIHIPNIKVIVTTRPHLKSRLENLLHRLSFHILPFNESNQIEFLTKYWISEHGAENGEMLEAFARKCLKSLETNMTDNEKKIAGIGIQCYMLAEVYAKQAKRAAELKSLPEDVVKITSIFEMYQSLTELKFNRIGNSEEIRQKYLDAHVHEAIALLFPDWLERFKSLLNPRVEVKEVMMYSIGLIENRPSSNTSKFLHRTFAENLLAQFTVSNIDRDATCAEFLFTEIFGIMGTTIDDRLSDDDSPPLRPALHRLRHPVIAYFVEMHLRHRFSSDQANGREILQVIDLTNISDEDVCTAINACCCHDLENCFDLSRKLLGMTNIKSKLSLREEYFKHLPHLVAVRTNNVSLLEKVLNLTKELFQVTLDWHVFERYVFPEFNLPECTPLHLAVYHGKYNMVIYLLQEYGLHVLSLKYLLHCCLIGSAENQDSVIEDKLSIIESLTEISRKWLEEEFEDRKPILQIDAHVNLIKFLVQVGVDINTCSKRFGTILHDGGDKDRYTDLLSWALKNGFNLINRANRDGKTPLMAAIKRFGIFEEDVLQTFFNSRVDFNAQDDVGDSVLFYAIQWTWNAEFVERILKFGARLAHTNHEGRNAAHILLQHNGGNYDQALELLKLFESRGFNGLRRKDRFGKTPVEYAITTGTWNDEMLKYFVEARWLYGGNCVLFYALRGNGDTHLIQKLLNLGENVNHRNLRGENAAHIVIRYQQDNPELALDLLKMLESNGFKGFNQMNYFFETPLALAKNLRVDNEELLKYLKDKASFCRTL